MPHNLCNLRMVRAFGIYRLAIVVTCLALLPAMIAHAQPISDSEPTNGPSSDAPLTLEAAIRESLAKSEESLILKEKQKRFQALKREAWSTAYPQIFANANVGRGASVMDPSLFPFGSGEPMPVFNVEQSRYAWDVGFQQSLFSFGRLGQVVKVANIQDQAETASRKRSAQVLQLQVLDAYYQLSNARARLQTLKASMQRAKETQAFLESNFKMGFGVRSSVLRALTALKSLEPERIRAERFAEGSRRMLNRMLGREVSAPLELDTSAHLELALLSTMPDSQAIQTILDERPDLKSMELSRQSLQGQAKYLRMLYRPSLGASGKYGITAFKLDQLSDIEKNHEWQIGVGVTWPIFDGFGLASKAQQVESDSRSLGLSARMMRKMTEVEIGGSYLEYTAADSAKTAAEQAVQAAQEAQAMLSEEFRAGKGQLTDLLDAEQALREATLGALDARYASIRSRAALRIALGKGLINEEAP
jgi:outer membrane protein